MSNIIYETETVEAETKGGTSKFWKGRVVEDGGKFYTQSLFWQNKKDGTSSEVQESALYLVETTNKGRSNERGGKEQGIFNITSDYQKKIDKGYHLEGVKSEVLPLPMLAHKYQDRKKSLGPNLYVQPKLDGIRMLQKDGQCWTREGKAFPDGVVDHLRVDTQGVVLDGELVLPAPYTFQETIAAAKKARETSKLLQFWVFDAIVYDTETGEMSALPFTKRSQVVRYLLNSIGNPDLIFVPTFSAQTEDEIMGYHAMFISEGYEGTIIRDGDSLYLPGHRSQHLLKFKDFQDDDYTITGVKEGGGKEVGCAIFTCETPEGKSFECRPKGTVEYRQEIFNTKANYIGKKLVVKYQNLSDDGIPRFPVGIGVRDYE